jgi:hypothetical protein
MIRYNLPDGKWRTSSYSADNGGQCVEVQITDDGLTAVGDSKARGLGAFTFARGQWAGFVAAVKRGGLRS